MIQKLRLSKNSVIYCGLITSGHRIIKYGIIRDRLSSEMNILYFEKEITELMNSFLCFIIRGIYDYVDSYKNKR
jgi:hypothetical protein